VTLEVDLRVGILFAVLSFAFVAAVGIGSVNVPPLDVVRIIVNRSFGLGTYENPAYMAIVWSIRLPRALSAFVVGAALAVSGAVMQSVLRNPLASSFTLGVSSGASLGAGIVIFIGFPVFSAFALPASGFIFGMGTMVLAVVLANAVDGRMENYTIILVGMVLSLFINAITTLMMALNRAGTEALVFWQMGSFGGQDWSTLAILAPVTAVGILLLMRYNREMDMLTFGEEQAELMGVSAVRVKWILLMIAAALTGSAIAFTGIIGFVDLVAPHVVRRLFGAKHILLIPLSAVFGGTFMMLCDLIARTIISPGGLPVGVVSALIGAPFFAYVYFTSRKNR